jgi:protocatechuate 3,4-dioxygenase, beta subunit
VLRAPRRPLIQLPVIYSDLTQPVYGHLPLGATDNDLTRQNPGGEPQGERITVSSRVVDEDGRPLPHVLIEVWQANAAGRYRHARDDHPAANTGFKIATEQTMRM